MNKDSDAENSALLLLIKNLQSSKNYRKFKERRMNSPHVKQDILFTEDPDQKKWDDLIDKCLTRREEDATL
ncbi:MAG: hypothetical protein PHF70_13060 [Opitutales bacterium]|nr:hypothetical protein [Opitutales bacterium]